ncbi:MAG: hypothetical protein LiPW15_679 [Parcubacteria group bacterium LiPW_15]|nr:MAG: hypothetical protein LiPW15_679 [Parcubacteria group bacterium LiPW_15]
MKKKTSDSTLVGLAVTGFLVAMVFTLKKLFNIDALPPRVPDRFGDSGVA